MVFRPPKKSHKTSSIPCDIFFYHERSSPHIKEDRYGFPDGCCPGCHPDCCHRAYRTQYQDCQTESCRAVPGKICGDSGTGLVVIIPFLNTIPYIIDTRVITTSFNTEPV